MTPDVYTNLWMVNVTDQSIQIGPSGGDNVKYWQYQMAQWFDGTVGDNLVTTKSTNTHTLQFLRGVGDEDDSAGAPFAFSGTPKTNFMAFYGGSLSNSGHFFQYKLVDLPEPFVIAADVNGGLWDQIADPTTIPWQVGPSSDYSEQQFPSDKDGYLFVVDLSLLAGDYAAKLYPAIASNDLSPHQASKLYSRIKEFMG